MINGGSQHIGLDGLTHYQRNREIYIAKAAKRKKENTAYIRAVKESIGCTDCHIKDWRVLDFDHLPQFNKIANLSADRVSGWSRARIDAEIAKCQVVCANCHRIRTYKRAGLV